MNELEQIQHQIITLQKKAEEIAKRNKTNIIEEVKAKIKAYSLTAKDLGLVNKDSSFKVSSVAVKYKQGEDTWTGRGRRPKWIEDYIAKGGTLDVLLVR